MIRKLIACFGLPVLAGCLSANVPNVAHWPVDYVAGDKSESTSKYGVARVIQVTVRSPYNAAEIAVLRSDGSVAFDPYNVFAAAPAQLLRGPVYDALSGSGLFASVLNASSMAASAVSVELLVTRLALDCRSGDVATRAARADIVLRLVDSKGGLIKTLPASGEADAEDGNYGRAFSQAVSKALDEALSGLR